MYLNRSIRIPRTHRVNWAAVWIYGASISFWMSVWWTW